VHYYHSEKGNLQPSTWPALAGLGFFLKETSLALSLSLLLLLVVVERVEERLYIMFYLFSSTVRTIRLKYTKFMTWNYCTVAYSFDPGPFTSSVAKSTLFQTPIFLRHIINSSAYSAARTHGRSEGPRLGTLLYSTRNLVEAVQGKGTCGDPEGPRFCTLLYCTFQLLPQLREGNLRGPELP
jgi:hypothetical protein